MANGKVQTKIRKKRKLAVKTLWIVRSANLKEKKGQKKIK